MDRGGRGDGRSKGQKEGRTKERDRRKGREGETERRGTGGEGKEREGKSRPMVTLLFDIVTKHEQCCLHVFV